MTREIKAKLFRRKTALIAFALSAVAVFSWSSFQADDQTSGARLQVPFTAPEIDKHLIAEQIGSAVQANEFPHEMELEVGHRRIRAGIEYSIDENLQARMQRLIARHRPDHAAFVAIDARTGAVLSMISYSHQQAERDNLALRASFPAASIFKVVTASAALDLNKANPETVVPFNGANHTLYKRNVQDQRITRWTRRMTMRSAFAKSVNVFFGKLGLFHVGAENLMRYAERFLFNQPIPADIPVQTGVARFSAEDPWSVVTAASGFTRENTMSPLHGAMIAAAVANDGVMMEPFVVQSLRAEDGETLYTAQTKAASVAVGPHSAEELRELFIETVKSGTSRKSFRSTVRRGDFEEVELGGKTGSLTGGDPRGKCDWFVGYARYREQRIAVAALTVNEEKWRVKSATLANEFLTQYIKDFRRSPGYAKSK